MLHLAAEGLGNPAIGDRLGISPRTAETHRMHVMQKLGLRTRTDLIVYALNRGMLPAQRPVPTGPPPADQDGGSGD